MGLYPCFEFLSDKTSRLWGISVLQLVKSLSAGNRNIFVTHDCFEGIYLSQEPVGTF